MKMHWKNWIFSICALTLVVACIKEEEEEIYVNTEFEYYFQRFEVAALERGMDLNIQDLTAHLSINLGANVAGVCETAGTGERTIRVDDIFWEQSDEWGREFVIFHELGHCVLGLGHRDEQDTEGNCISIMQSGLSGCTMPYSEETRKEYLDELFQ